MGCCWLLRLTPGAGIWQLSRQEHLPGRLLLLIGAHALHYLLWLFSWWMVGRGALQDRLDLGWLMAWALLLLTLVPLRLLATWSAGLLAIGCGWLLKQRVLYGALRLEPDESRHQGVGQLLGRLLESEAVETLAMSGGLLGLVAVIELIVATGVLWAGSGGGFHVLLLSGWVALTFFLGGIYLCQRRGWTRERLEMTHDLVEKMVGHRTRLVQEGVESWHEGEDRVMEHYLMQSVAMDRTASKLMALVPRGWLVLGLCGLTPALLSSQGSPEALAVGLGGMLLVYRALEKLTAGLWHLAGAAIAWEQALPPTSPGHTCPAPLPIKTGRYSSKPAIWSSATTKAVSRCCVAAACGSVPESGFCWREPPEMASPPSLHSSWACAFPNQAFSFWRV